MTLLETTRTQHGTHHYTEGIRGESSQTYLSYATVSQHNQLVYCHFPRHDSMVFEIRDARSILEPNIKISVLFRVGISRITDVAPSPCVTFRNFGKPLSRRCPFLGVGCGMVRGAYS